VSTHLTRTLVFYVRISNITSGPINGRKSGGVSVLTGSPLGGLLDQLGDKPPSPFFCAF
jgi:hypothetical protein